MRSLIKFTIFSLALVCFVSTAIAKDTVYHLMMVDDTEIKCNILENDVPTKRLRILNIETQEEQWVSTLRIIAIIDQESQIDVTRSIIAGEALQQEPLPQAQQPQPAKQDKGMGAGATITIAILGTIAALVLLGAIAN